MTAHPAGLSGAESFDARARVMRISDDVGS